MRTRSLSRRDLLSTAALSLPGILALRSATRAADDVRTSSDTRVIFVMLGGGASQHETYDPKPEAPVEYRGDFRAISTSVPGVPFCELMPKQAQRAHRLAILRTMTHHEASHIALHVVETGYFLRVFANGLAGEMPAIGCVAAKVRGNGTGGLPGFVSLPKPHAYSGPHYLGRAVSAYNVDSDPNSPEFTVPNMTLAKGITSDRLADRQAILTHIDATRRTLDAEPEAIGVNGFRKQALDLMTGEAARRAFDLSLESPKLRDAYGRNTFGQRLLLARRLAESGVPFVMVRTFDWDDHDKLPERMSKRCPEYDNGLSALLDDLHDRGLNENVLVVAMGEFGRTPRVNTKAGRDHWPGVSSVLFAGGSYRMGQVIGTTDAHGGTVKETPLSPQRILAMMYRHLGIDPGLTFPDFGGRPRHILEDRDPIRELL